MNIIERKDNEFIKYMIQLNEEKLKEIRQEVIEKCGEITHYSLESKREPDLNTVGVVKNFQKNFLREEDHDDFYTRWVNTIYQYEYDIYATTPLTDLIDRLLSGDVSAIAEINQPKQETPLSEKYSKEKENIKQEINQLLIGMKEVDIQKLESLKEQLQALQEKEKRNRNRQSDLTYYSQVASCIKKVEVMRMDKQGIVKINDILAEAIQLIEEEIDPFFNEEGKKKMSVAAYQKMIGSLNI